MVKSFVKSSEFKSLFTLKLLADTLCAIVEKCLESRASLKKTVKETLEGDTSKRYAALMDLIQPQSTKPNSTKDLGEEEEGTPSSNQRNISDDSSFTSIMSSSTVLFNLSESIKDGNPTEANTTANGTSISKVSNFKSPKEADFFEGSDQDKNERKSPKMGKISRNAIKKKFFKSDSDASDSSSSDSHKITRTSRKRTKIKKEKVAKVNDKKEGVEEDENTKLEKLLRMTNSMVIARKNATMYSSDTEGEEEGGEGKEGSVEKTKEVSKPKKEKMEKEKETLMDYLNLAENPNCDVTSKAESEDERENSNKFLTEFNDEVKNAFLLSSTVSEISGDSEVEDSKKVKKEKKKENKKEVRKLRKSRRDDLAKYRISSSSSEDEVKEVGSSDSTVSFEIISDDDTADEDDNDSGKKPKLAKKFPGIKSEEVILTESESSDSDIEQIPVVKSQESPTKGRKNIQKIFTKDSLQTETKQALKTENERKKRLSERKKVFDKYFADSSRLVLDFDPKTHEEIIVVDESLSNKLKPHQRDGVKFMWDSCFESLERMKEDPGSGCILAHCMGLGKTLQVISLVHTILSYQTAVKSVMILCPLNTLKNWIHEFKMWLKDTKKRITVYDIISSKTKYQKIDKVKLWKGRGGVMVLSYETLRSLLRKGNHTKAFFRAFLDPGPDMVVCDEGHMLKNENSALYKCISQVKTSRRIILTGTPLQNNLIEYYCMVQFVKPNILGTRKEFMNRFVNPINNGQFEDSTQLDVRVMKRRAHVLHTMLNGFIQRFGYYVLTPFLPEKQEYVISITLTETQKELYRLFIRGETENEYRSEGLFNDFSWLQKVWTHPWVMLQYARKNSEIEDERTDRPIHRPERMKEHWGKLVSETDYEDIRGSGKLVLLFGILKKCNEVGDKILVFSQHLSTLNMIEHFLQKMSWSYFSGDESPSFRETWVLGEDYFRMDGSTSVENRHIYCRKFNNKDNKRSRLFLISTRAGGLGINLVGANRVVIFDASWNPSHDVQSIFRVYRFGQEKPCYIYRFLAEATMEEKIYKRQVNKLSLAHRILDEHQIERHYTMGNLQELYRYEPTPREKWEVPKVPKDKLFAEILVRNQDIIVGYHEHDSLLENKEEEELTEEERRVAWEEFEKEKQPQKLPNGLPLSSVGSGLLMRSVPVYKPPFASTPVNRGMFNQSSSQLCKIVEVRTLQRQPEAHYPIDQLTDLDMGTLIDIGRVYGVIPYEGEIAHNYRLRLARSMKNVMPWGTPVMGKGNQTQSPLNSFENQLPTFSGSTRS